MVNMRRIILKITLILAYCVSITDIGYTTLEILVKEDTLRPMAARVSSGRRKVVHNNLIERAGWYTKLNRILALLAGIEPGDRVLDIGAGTGDSTAVLLEQLNYEHESEVIALEPNKKYLNLAKTVLGGYPQVTFIESKADKAKDLITGPVDACFLFNTIRLIDDHNRLFRDVSSILRPGGILAFNTAHFMENDSEMRRIQRTISMGIMRNVKEANHSLRSRKKLQRRSAEDYKRALEQAGFEIANVEIKEVDVTLDELKIYYSDPSRLDFIAPSLSKDELNELVYKRLMDDLEKVRNEGRTSIKGKWLFIVARVKNINATLPEFGTEAKPLGRGSERTKLEVYTAINTAA